nr:ovarian-specific serine/threonine-protein kinase Lok-like [Leptinotarsa decemlineata]
MRTSKKFDLVAPELILGRSEECDIVIHKSKFLEKELVFVSKEHFIIQRDFEDEFIVYLHDLSKNGTYVNDALVGRHKRIIIQNNDSIAIGNKLKVYIYKSMNHPVEESFIPAELRKKYVTSRLLGVGGCGQVRLVYDKVTCQQYALKKITKSRDSPSQIHNINHPKRVETEITILEGLSHPLIVRTKEILEDGSDVYIVLEYMKGGELSTRISCGPTFSESTAKFFFYQMVLAVQYLHSVGITHRDLKPGNILLSTTDTKTLLKITDFGLSFLLMGYEEVMKTVCGTLFYIAPEILNPTIKEYNSQVDIWSLGVILFYMLSKQLPFQSNDRASLVRLIINGKYSMKEPIWYEISFQAKDLIAKMLKVNPKERINIHDILSHSWIEKDHLLRYTVENMLKKEVERNQQTSMTN